MTNPFHEGEIAVQELTGERPAAILNGRVIAPTIPQPAVGFVAAQELVVLSRERSGELWAQIIYGPKGFASASEDRGTLRLDFADDAPLSTRHSPMEDIGVGDRIGGLFIEFATRRRLRVNGTIKSTGQSQLEVAIAEAYPACPKYIQRRVPELVRADAGNVQKMAVTSGVELDADLRDWIERADTLFVASGNPKGELDISHRGGDPGFVKVIDGGLRVPDYPGNSMFNTLGNLTLDPRAAIVIPDFETGRQLSVTGAVELDLEHSERSPDDATGGTGRWWTFRPSAWRLIATGWDLSWGDVDRSPFNPAPQAEVKP